MTNKLEQLELFLVDQNKAINEEIGTAPEVQESFVNPNIELKLRKEKRQACRDILLEIRNFGISQRQVMYLIYLLALELEDQQAMKSIVEAVGANRDNVPLTKDDVATKEVVKEKKKLIL